MTRRLALTLTVLASACTPAEDPPQGPPVSSLEEARQSVEPLAAPSEENALRFLEQATFGPRLALGASPLPIDSVEYVVSAGITQSITAQFNAPPSQFVSTENSADLGAQFFVNAVTGQDQLRQRVAFALSQIFVVSQVGIPDLKSTLVFEPKEAMAGYLNLLSSRAFGTYRQLLDAVTKDPAMGTYLDMANNKAFKANGDSIEPNENYARELLQLFSLGLHKLNEDGTVVEDPVTGAPVPAYTEAQVQAFAHAFSGWTYGGAACPTIGKSNTASYTQPMIGCDVNHDSTSQVLLRGFATTAGGTATKHLKEALDNIEADPNVPPFISKQLIQHLVTSNPSTAYVQRVVNVFKNNGSGVRGDLRAVVRAILQDDEARGPQPPVAQYASYGHLRSPVLFITTLVRWLNVQLDTSGGKDPGAKLNSYSRSLGQYVPRPPSVFSYYPPNAPAPGANGLLGPEFAILDTATVTARANFVHELLYAAAPANAGILIDLSVLPTDPNDSVLWLNRYLLHGTMSSDLQLTVYNAMTDPRAGDLNRRKKLALFLTSLSPEFQIQR